MCGFTINRNGEKLKCKQILEIITHVQPAQIGRRYLHYCTTLNQM